MVGEWNEKNTIAEGPVYEQSSVISASLLDKPILSLPVTWNQLFAVEVAGCSCFDQASLLAGNHITYSLLALISELLCAVIVQVHSRTTVIGSARVGLVKHMSI